MEVIDYLIKVLIIVACYTGAPISYAFGQCIVPLGMEEGKIPDNAITASSSYEMKSVGPQNARDEQNMGRGILKGILLRNPDLDADMSYWKYDYLEWTNSMNKATRHKGVNAVSHFLNN